MARKKLPYQRGSIVQVPIADARRVAVGVIGDLDGRGAILGFFYLLDTLPANWAELRLLAPQDARLVRHCGDLGLMNGTWTVLIEPAPDFDPTPWQRLEFGLQQELTGLWVIRTYAPGVFEAPESRRATEEEARALPKDGMAGAGWIEGRLSRIAAEQRDKPTKPAAPPRRRAAA